MNIGAHKSKVTFFFFEAKLRGINPKGLKLKWKDVDLETGYVTYPGMITKNARTQSLPVNQNCLAILKRCKELKLTHWVFPSSTGAYYQSFEATWKRLKTKLALPYRFHDLRHTMASYLASSGQIDIMVLRDLLGHRELKMTQRYSHLINGALKKGANIADDVFKAGSLGD
jgi:integrase